MIAKLIAPFSCVSCVSWFLGLVLGLLTNLATLSNAAPPLISDLTLICKIVCAFPATWPLVGSFVIFRVFASPTRPPSTAAPRVGTGHRVVGSRQLRKRGSLEDARMARRSYGGTCCLATLCSTWNADKSKSSPRNLKSGVWELELAVRCLTLSG